LWRTLGHGTVEAAEWSSGYDAAVPVSARDGSGIPELLAEIERILIDQMVEVHALIPYSRGDMLAQIHELGVIDAETATANGTRVQAHVPPRLAAYLTDFVETRIYDS